MSDDGNFFANITQLMCQTWSLRLWFHQKYPQKISTLKIFFKQQHFISYLHAKEKLQKL